MTSVTNNDTKVFPAEMQIAHLDNNGPRNPLTGPKPSHWKLIASPVNPQPGAPKVAHLDTVSWLDVAAVFKNQQAGKYKVQWRLNQVSAHPDLAFVDTEFRAVTFKEGENPADTAISQDRAPASLLKSSSIQEFMQHTDRPNTVPARATTMTDVNRLRQTPGYDPDVQGFFTLTLPNEVQIEQSGGVFVQIRNHGSGLKSGLQIEYAQLLPVN
ncbi:hypothetical protein BGZ46_005781 [Entomortierella lignicola]|nr:hypothetical protein BGZ46_005781 [Entomortierella lignicola]